MRFLIFAAILSAPTYCLGALGILIEGPGYLSAEKDYVLNAGRFDAQGDGVPELVYEPTWNQLRALDKAGNEVWSFTLDPAAVCPTCDPAAEYWSFWFEEFVDTEPGQRDAVVSFDFYDWNTGLGYRAMGLVSATTGELRQLITGRAFKTCLDLDADGLWELLLFQSASAGHWEVWGYGSSSSAGDPVDVTPDLRLLQNHPNPFNPRTTVPFELSQACEVRVEFFDSNGRLIDVMDLGRLGPGSHRCEWSARGERGRSLPSGNYYYSVVSAGARQSRKMLLMK